MKLSHYRSQLEKVIAHRNGYLVLALACLALSFLLAILNIVLIGRERIILTPPTIEKSFWVSARNVSAEYLSEMTTFFAYLRLNATPDTIATQRDTLLQYTEPTYFETLKAQLIKEADDLTQQHLTIAFYPVNVAVNPNQLQATITGDLKSFVADTALPVQRVSYQLQYRYDAGRLLVSSFKEVKDA